MQNNVDNDYIKAAIDELVGFFGLKEEPDLDKIISLVRGGSIKEASVMIARQLGLPIEINIVYVPDNYRSQEGEHQFHSTDIIKVDHSGRSSGGITAQVIIPGHLPFYGSTSLINFPITVKVSKSCVSQPGSFVVIMAHELSHILLHSSQFRQKENEIYTDLTALISGFTSSFQRGRSVSKSWESYNVLSRTVHTSTTTYGYLTDYQFNFAKNKIHSELEKDIKSKSTLLNLVAEHYRTIDKYEINCKKFKQYFEHLSRNYNKKISKEDSERIMMFFQPGYLEELESYGRRHKEINFRLLNYARSVSHFTSGTLVELNKQSVNLKKETNELGIKFRQLKSDLRVLRRHVPLNFRVKNFFNLKEIVLLIKSFFDLRFARVIKKYWSISKTYVIFIVVVLIVFSVISRTKIFESKSTGNEVRITDSPTRQQLPVVKPVIAPVEIARNYLSLSNGTILLKNYTYLKGLGKLDINNGTDFDAVAKLVNTLNDKSVYTVYIKANSQYTISSIRDGVYKLVFNLGNDWDKNTKKFLVNGGYEIFEEDFNFDTSKYYDEDYEHTRYSTFRVTLNPVLNGTAKTNDIDSTQFENY